MSKKDHNYTPLKNPIPLSEQKWPENVTPLVCVRTMTYNHEDYIRDCIEGFLMQRTTFPVRLLIHDDASTDQTASIVREYENKYPGLFKVFYQEENTFKKKFKLQLRSEFMGWSIGKYEALCEGDDYWTDPLKLQKQVEFLDENEEYSFCTTYSVDDVEFAGNNEELNFLEYSQKDFILGKKFQTRTCTVLLRNVRGYITQVKNNYAHVTSGDKFLKIILTENGKKAAVLPFVGAFYRRHSGGIWSSLSTVNLLKNKINNNRVFVTYCVDNKKYYLAFVLAYRVIRDKIKLGILKLIGK